MARRKQRGRGGGRGYRGDRGFGGGGGGRGGRGGGGGGRGRGRGRGLGYDVDDEYVDYSRDYSRRGAPSPNARGQKRAGRGGGSGFDYEPGHSDNSDYYYRSTQSTPVRGANPGRGSSRGNGHQRGHGGWSIAGPNGDQFGPKDFLRKRLPRSGNASLSQLLYEDRPYLKPITFVRSEATPTLFLRDEEIFKPVAEEAGEQEASHAPTADRVYRIFHGGNLDPQPSEVLSDEEELLEIDYADLGKFMSEFHLARAATSSKETTTVTAAATTAATSTATSLQKDDSQLVVTATVEAPPCFYIDTKPSAVQDSSTSTNDIAVEHPSTAILGEDIDEDEEIIVYVAPHPRNSKLASAHTQSSAPDAKSLPPAAVTDPVAVPVHQQTPDAPRTPTPPPKPEPKLWPETLPKDVVVPAPAPTPAPAFKDFSFKYPQLSKSPKRRPRRAALRKAEWKAKFRLRGAMRAEATLRELDTQRAEQRRGDSDVDWGGSTSGVAEVEDSETDGGMLVDRDIGADAMAAFVRGMGVAGQAHVSAGDLEDEERIRLEDADEDEEEDESSDEEVDTELELADGLHGILAAESEDDDETASRNSVAEDEEDETSDDDEVTPKRSFHARLERIRSRTAGQPVQDMMREELDQDEENGDDLDSDSNIDGEDDIIARMESFLDENDDILRGAGRRQRNFVFRAISNERFEVELDDFIDASPKRKKDKHKHIPAELQAQWDRDREKKAERKRLRELERIAAATAELFTPTKKKKGKKARKARQAAAAAMASLSLETITEHIRAFITDLDGAPTLSLPPMTREMRKSVHELAHAFSLKSKSEGKGETRFTRLTKTTLSGAWVDERKVAQILGKSKLPPPHGNGDRKGKGKGKGKAGVKIRPRDGELVGGAAPKIDRSNVGFQMLAGMGWEEGSRIGAVGGVGLDVPLLAVIKTTKLGLGASSYRS